MSIKHTVAICTANRAGVVRVALERLSSVLTFQLETEILIINNGIEDDTRILEQHCTAVIPQPINWSVLYEPNAGLSNARNRAIDAASGEWITFLDDDAFPVDTNWQVRIVETLSKRPSVGVMGGPSRLVPPSGCSENPWWRSESTDLLHSCSEGPRVTGVCAPHMICGVNATYRIAAIGELRFDSRLGWNSKVRVPFAGEETLLNQKVCKGGWDGWWDVECSVMHMIEPQRYSPRWLSSRAAIHGRTGVLFSYLDGHGPAKVLARSLAKLILLASAALYDCTRMRFDEAFSKYCKMRMQMASAAGVIRFSRSDLLLSNDK